MSLSQLFQGIRGAISNWLVRQLEAAHDRKPGEGFAGMDLHGFALNGMMDLRGMDMRGTNLSCTILKGQDLTDADMRGADLRGADLTDARLSGANLMHAITDQDTLISDHQLRQAVNGDQLLCVNGLEDPQLPKPEC